MDINDEKVIKIGLMRYINAEYKVYICESNIFPGTGDYEDESQIQNDIDIKCYKIIYETTFKGRVFYWRWILYVNSKF